MSSLDPATSASRTTGPTRPQALPPAPPPVAGASQAAALADRTSTGLDNLIVRLGPPYARLLNAAKAGDQAAARAALGELEPLLAAGRSLAAGSPYAEAFAKVDAAAEAVRAQAAGAAPGPERAQVMVGLPGRGGRMVAVERPARPEPRGPLAGLGEAASQLGKGLSAVGHVAFFPLELAGKALDPLRAWAGEALGGAKQAIDGSVGQVPVIGQAVRFTTGLAASLVGMVDGALQGVTHPVELLTGLGHMAWTVVGLMPGVRTAWDVAVEGKTVRQSLGDAWGEGGAIATAFFDGAIKDARAGNWSGALGRVTGDIGSFFITGGAAGGAKAAAVGSAMGRASKLTRVARVVRAAKLDRVASAGARAIGIANQAGAKIITGGMRANFGAWGRAGKLASRLPGGQRVVALGDAVAARLRGGHKASAPAGPLVTPAAVMDRPKVASRIPAEALAGEVRPATPLTHEAAIARQADVLAELERTPWMHEALPDRVISGLLDTDTNVLKAMKGLLLDGKPVTSMDEAARAWKQLPADSPLRAKIGKELAAMIQQGWQDGLGFPPATVEFKALPENLAGVEARGKIMIDPAVLGEDLDFVVQVLAEEQTHAYQRFLVDNREALAIPKRIGVEVEKYARDFSHETYIYPPNKALATFADDVKKLARGAADGADEVDYMAIRRRLVKEFAAGTPERAVLDTWWGAVGDESKQLSYLKLAADQLAAASKNGTERIWRMDFEARLPKQLLERDGVKLSLADTAAELKHAIDRSQGRLSAANGEVETFFRTWEQAYANQALEFTAKATADGVAKWILEQ